MVVFPVFLGFGCRGQVALAVVGGGQQEAAGTGYRLRAAVTVVDGGVPRVPKHRLPLVREALGRLYRRKRAGAVVGGDGRKAGQGVVPEGLAGDFWGRLLLNSWQCYAVPCYEEGLA